jgi:hypothetical protein
MFRFVARGPEAHLPQQQTFAMGKGFFIFDDASLWLPGE